MPFLFIKHSQNSLRCGSNYEHGVLRRAYFDGFQSVAVSFIAEFSFPLCCFVFDINRLKVKFAHHYAITQLNLKIFVGYGQPNSTTVLDILHKACMAQAI